MAIIDHGAITWYGALGYRETDNNEPVDTNTLFQAASLSKLPNAMLTLHLVDHRLITLDSNLCSIVGSDLCGGQPLTLRQLLSHTAGFNIHGFNGYLADGYVPTEWDVLRGKYPAKNPPVRREYPIGEYKYSGGGVLISQIAIETIAHMQYDSLVTQTILHPLALDRSTYFPPLHDPNCAFGYHAGKIVNGHSMIYPALAAGGLWTTAEDYAKLLLEIVHARGDHGTILNSEDVRQMLGNSEESVPGLGVFVSRKNNVTAIDHSGEHQGFYSFFKLNLNSGRGIVMFFNSDEAETLGKELEKEVMQD